MLEKRLKLERYFNFKIHDVATWFTDNCKYTYCLNISESKGNQTLKFGKLIEYNQRNTFLQKLCEKWGKMTSSRLLFIFLKSLIHGESKKLSLNKFWQPSTCHAIKTNYIKLQTKYWSRDMLNFNFSEKGLELVSLPHSVYDFSREMLFMLHSINWSNLIVWLSLLLEILGNMCVTIVC